MVVCCANILLYILKILAKLAKIFFYIGNISDKQPAVGHTTILLFDEFLNWHLGPNCQISKLKASPNFPADGIIIMAGITQSHIHVCMYMYVHVCIYTYVHVYDHHVFYHNS